MKPINHYLILCNYKFIVLFSMLFIVTSCEIDRTILKEETILLQEIDLKTNKHLKKAKSKVVEVSSSGMNFTAPSQISAGWITFMLSNNSPTTHFLILQKLPEGKTVEDSKREIIPVFQDAMNLLNVGDLSGFDEFENLQ